MQSAIVKFGGDHPFPCWHGFSHLPLIMLSRGGYDIWYKKIHCGVAFDPPSLIWCRGFYVQNILLTWISWYNCFVCRNTTNYLFCNPQARMLISANIIYLQSKALQSVSVNKTIILLFINMQTNKELMTWSSWLNICVSLHDRLSIESLPAFGLPKSSNPCVEKTICHIYWLKLILSLINVYTLEHEWNTLYRNNRKTTKCKCKKNDKNIEKFHKYSMSCDFNIL
jgi:hypothetical protein